MQGIRRGRTDSVTHTAVSRPGAAICLLGCIALLVLAHGATLLTLPFGMMSDSLAYVSFGLDLVHLPDLGQSYRENPYFPIGYPLVIGLLAAYVSREHMILAVLVLQHLVALAVETWLLVRMRSHPGMVLLATAVFVLVPEFCLFPQVVMSESLVIPLHALFIVCLVLSAERRNARYVVLGAGAAFAMVFLRAAPLPQLLLAVGWMFAWRRIRLDTALAYGGAAMLGLLAIVALNAWLIGQPVVTSSRGKHMHDRVICVQRAPLDPSNATQARIVALVGEACYRKPHWYVEQALVDHGFHIGVEVDDLLWKASAPAVLAAPLPFLWRSLDMTRTLLVQPYYQNFAMQKARGWPNDIEAAARQFDWNVLGDRWERYLTYEHPTYLGWVAAALLIAALVIVPLAHQDRSTAWLLYSYAPLGVFLTTLVAGPDGRRIRELYGAVAVALVVCVWAVCTRVRRGRRTTAAECFGVEPALGSPQRPSVSTDQGT